MPRPSSQLSAQDKIELKLAREYHSSLASYKKVLSIAKPLIEYELLDLMASTKSWERIDVLARVKSFDSALNKLRKRGEGNPLEINDSFANLNDMVALKIRVFPNDYLSPIDKLIKGLFPKAKSDHKPKRISGVRDEEYYNGITRLKYITVLDKKYKIKTKFEIQIVPFMLDAFMDIEHDVIYKPDINIPKIIPRLMEEKNNSLIEQLKMWPTHFSELMQKYKKK